MPANFEAMQDEIARYFERGVELSASVTHAETLRAYAEWIRALPVPPHRADSSRHKEGCFTDIPGSVICQVCGGDLFSASAINRSATSEH